MRRLSSVNSCFISFSDLLQSLLVFIHTISKLIKSRTSKPIRDGLIFTIQGKLSVISGQLPFFEAHLVQNSYSLVPTLCVGMHKGVSFKLHYRHTCRQFTRYLYICIISISSCRLFRVFQLWVCHHFKELLGGGIT